MEYGYIRVSTKEQNEGRQIDALRTYNIPDKQTFMDKQSGKNFDRPQYKKLIKKLKPGDLLYVLSIDRLGRNYDMIIEEWAYITKFIDCDIVVLDMNLLDTRSENKNLVGKFIADIVLQILSFVAENERTNIKQRQAEGIRIAKEQGVKFGRPNKKLPSNFKEVARQYLDKKISFEMALEKTKLTKSTFYKYIILENI